MSDKLHFIIVNVIKIISKTIDLTQRSCDDVQKESLEYIKHIERVNNKLKLINEYSHLASNNQKNDDDDDSGSSSSSSSDSSEYKSYGPKKREFVKPVKTDIHADVVERTNFCGFNFKRDFGYELECDNPHFKSIMHRFVFGDTAFYGVTNFKYLIPDDDKQTVDKISKETLTKYKLYNNCDDVDIALINGRVSSFAAENTNEVFFIENQVDLANLLSYSRSTFKSHSVDLLVFIKQIKPKSVDKESTTEKK